MKARDIANYARKLIRECIDDLKSGGEVYEDWDERRYKSIFLGTVFALCPSGKYYLPFACSNVTPCPVCKGTGEMKNKHYDHVAWKEANAYYQKIAELLRSGTITFAQLKKHPDVMSKYDAAYHITHFQGMKIHCTFCNGVGSREAYEDEIFYEALEDEAQKFNAWIASGEGDPCDILLCCDADEEPDDEHQTQLDLGSSTEVTVS